MALNSGNRELISFKKLFGKAHTQEDFTIGNEGISSNVQIASTTIFGQPIDPLPVTNGGLTNLGNTDGIVEKVRFELEILNGTKKGLNQSQGYALKLPAGYNGSLKDDYSGGTLLYTALGKLQIVPKLYGELKVDFSTEYDPVLYQTDGSTIIPSLDRISWNLDPYNGIIFIQDPKTNYDNDATRPGFLDAYLYVGDYLDSLSGVTFNQELRVVTATTDASVTIPTIANNIHYVASGTTTYTLPANPNIGTFLTFTDGLGSADIDNITINGNNKIIYDDTFALINTDYGSITIEYNGIFWSVSASVT